MVEYPAEVFLMKKHYVPPEKRSKKQQKEYYAMQRKDWNGVNPATKKMPNMKAYDRKKTGQWNEHEPLPGFFIKICKGVMAWKN
jgi:hypothetical protein